MSEETPPVESLPMEERLAKLEKDVANLAAGIARVAAQRTPPPVRSWLVVDDPDIAAGILHEIGQWLEIVWTRYEGPPLPDCWAYHPAVVEELLTTMDHHKGCFAWSSTPALSDWHDRYRPGVAARIQRYAQSCELSLHAAGGELDPASRKPVPGLSELAHVARHWAVSGTCPSPRDSESPL